MAVNDIRVMPAYVEAPPGQTPAERLALKKAMVPVHKEMESRIGKETIEAVYKATGFDPGKL